MSIAITINAHGSPAVTTADQESAPEAPGLEAGAAPGSSAETSPPGSLSTAPGEPIDAGGPPSWVLAAVTEAGGLTAAEAVDSAHSGAHDGGAAPAGVS